MLPVLTGQSADMSSSSAWKILQHHKGKLTLPQILLILQRTSAKAALYDMKSQMLVWHFEVDVILFLCPTSFDYPDYLALFLSSHAFMYDLEHGHIK